MLTASRGVADYTGIIRIEQEVDRGRGRGEGEPEVTPGAEGVRKGVHHRQEDDDTEWIPLVDSYSEGNWRCGPFAGGDGCRQASVP